LSQLTLLQLQLAPDIGGHTLDALPGLLLLLLLLRCVPVAQACMQVAEQLVVLVFHCSCYPCIQDCELQLVDPQLLALQIQAVVAQAERARECFQQQQLPRVVLALGCGDQLQAGLQLCVSLRSIAGTEGAAVHATV
jgi:hypothetical protein